jgi:hypothetical protein
MTHEPRPYQFPNRVPPSSHRPPPIPTGGNGKQGQAVHSSIWSPDRYLDNRSLDQHFERAISGTVDWRNASIPDRALTLGCWLGWAVLMVGLVKMGWFLGGGGW